MMIDRVARMGKKKPPIRLPAVAAVILLTLACLPAVSNADGGTANKAEKAAVLQAAREFLDAEKTGDHARVYACFAPSSPYARSHTYEDYLRQVKSSEDRVASYTIMEVSYIQNNEDLKTWPSIQKIAQVEVVVVFVHIPTKKRSELNIGFIFLKEGGRWYKS
ncbi:MAG: hypothetical protein JXA41_15180 [Deltaproteobacteria bacterium]|nr:hypothetical protein [Deltaproteobacteria bacterium]